MVNHWVFPWILVSFSILWNLKVVPFREIEPMGFIFIHPYSYIKVKVSVLQSYATLSNPMNCSPPGSSVHEILQTRILEWIAISSSRGSSQTMDQTWVSWIAGRFFTILAISHISISISVSIMEIHYEELAHTVMEDKKCCDLLLWAENQKIGGEIPVWV